MILKNRDTMLRVIIAFLFLATLLPIIRVGLHARPHLDDLAFTASSSFAPSGDAAPYIARSVRQAILHGNTFDVVQAVWHTIQDNYVQWQGTFSAIAIFSLHPGVLFGEELYPLTMLFTLGALLLAKAILCKTIFSKPWLPFLLLAFLFVQWLPSLPNGFFWWNGATYYTLFYSFMLLSISCKIRLMRGESMWYLPPLILLNFIIGGGNFITALVNLEIAFCFFAFALWKRQKIGIFVSAFATAGIGFLISILAPGNAIRQALYSTPDAISAVGLSLERGILDIIQWTTPIVVAMFLLLLPHLWRWVGEQKFDFRYPGFILIGSFLLFASFNTPPLYAIGFEGCGKIRNIVYYTYLWLVLGNACYLLGWLRYRLYDDGVAGYPSLFPNVKANCEKLVRAVMEQISRFPRQLFATSYGFALVALLLCLPGSNAALSAYELRSGIIHEFSEEYRERLSIMRTPAQTTPEVAPFSVHPFSLVPWEEGRAELDTRLYAWYYGKAYITALPQARPIAAPNQLVLHTHDGIPIELSTYLINNNNFVRLNDLAREMANVFDVVYLGSDYSIIMGRAYTSDGRETHEPSGWIVADLRRKTILVDGVLYKALSYYIDGLIYYGLRDIFEIIGYEITWYEGVTRIFPANGISS